MNACLGRPQVEGQGAIDAAVVILQWIWFLPAEAVLDLIRLFPSFAEFVGYDHLGCRNVISALISFVFWLSIVLWWSCY